MHPQRLHSTIGDSDQQNTLSVGLCGALYSTVQLGPPFTEPTESTAKKKSVLLIWAVGPPSAKHSAKMQVKQSVINQSINHHAQTSKALDLVDLKDH
jgi:hypothetical protein